MDTRSKILTVDAALRLAPPAALATGFFDILRAEHVRELRALAGRGPLLVVVLPLDGAALDQRARAELVAGLRMVDYVVPADAAEASTLIDTLKPARAARLEEGDAVRARRLTEHVHRRQSR